MPNPMIRKFQPSQSVCGESFSPKGLHDAHKRPQRLPARWHPIEYLRGIFSRVKDYPVHSSGAVRLSNQSKMIPRAGMGGECDPPFALRGATAW